ncbi:MAG TPA: hypothetical protein VI386_14595 [Candidatus Sulfotelmatobacter sp.]
MSIQEVSAEQLAELFHNYHEALGADLSGKTQSSLRSWDQLPGNEKKRLRAAARLAILEISRKDVERQEPRPYFAKPGEAEWGC